MMQNIYSHYKQELKGALRSLGYSAADVDRIRLQPPREKIHGDMATNAALVLGNRQKQNPRETAQALAPALQDIEGIEKIEIAGAGFINLFLKDEVWQKQVKVILEEGSSYGKSSMGEGKKVNVEYVSANPTGPLHIGHARGAIFGDCLATLMENAGYEVAREYYVNDEGVQIDILAKSLLLRIAGEEVPAGENLYRGTYLIDLAKTMDRKILTLSPEAQHQAIRKEAVKAMMVLIKKELAQLNIKHDIFSYESKLHQDRNIEKAVAALENKGLVYQGSLPPPKGKEDEWEAEEQTLFRSSQFGDDRDRSIKKANGDWTYFAGDIAYHYDKIKRGSDILINVFGSDHGGYVKRLNGVVQALSDNKVALDICLMHLVRVVRNGKPEMMSKRAGNFIGLQELLDEIGADALRFIMLTRKHDAPLDIDIEVLKQQSNDNPVFYVQYAHARCCSVLAQGGNFTPKPTLELLQNLNHGSELNLIKILSLYTTEITAAALDKAPHRLAFYLQDLAAAFHALWNQGMGDKNLRFTVKNDTIKAARLSLVCATRQVLSNGLNLMGIKPIEELR